MGRRNSVLNDAANEQPFDEDVPEWMTDLPEFSVAAPERCDECGGWQGFVAQVHPDGRRARVFCSTPHLPTEAIAMARARRIAAALCKSTTDEFPATVGRMQ